MIKTTENLKKLAIISTHPIQYNAPVFRLLAERGNIKIKVFYTWENSQDGIFDKKFNQTIKWDIPLLDGYEYTFVKNTAQNQGSGSYSGIKNPSLNQDILEWKPDAILIFGWNFHSHLRAMRYFKGKIPVFFRGDSTLLDEKPGFKTILRRQILRFVYRKLDFAFYVGINNKQYYLKHGLKEPQLIYAPHGIDNDRFNNDNECIQKAMLWRGELGIGKDDIVFLFAGKFEPKKDPKLFVQAANNIKKGAYKFILTGDGVLKSELQEMAGQNPNIIFLPFQNQSVMPVLYRLGDVFVLPSKGPGETWGLAVNEAMACGKAIIVSDKTGCAPDLIEDKKNGFVFKTGDLYDLIIKLEYFNLERSIKFGDYSKNKIKNYNFIKIAEAIENAITKL